MEKNVEFRKAMRGYNKEDVNKFISDENIRFNRLEESYTKKIDERDREIGELLNKLSIVTAAEEENRRLNSVIDSLHGDITDLNCKITEKDLLIEGLRDAVSQANSQIQSLEESVANIESCRTTIVNEDPDIEIYKEKAERYDAIYEQVDEILNFAKEEAEKILKEAAEIRLAAEKAERAAKRDALAMKNSVRNKSDSIIDDLKKSIRHRLNTITK